ncbi:hypothetical protein EAF04_004349 [Stromatinia cepivora]|nr:hypothetical protein EAF04_004349 [Stromatinia cepivora]
MTTKIRLFLFTPPLSPSILQNGPVSSPASSSSSILYSKFGPQALESTLSRTIIEYVPIQCRYVLCFETFTFEIHEKQGTKAEEFDVFLADFFEKNNGQSNNDAVILFGFPKDISDEISKMMIEKHLSPSTITCVSKCAIFPTCNLCVRSFCQHLQYDKEFLKMYWGLLRSVKEKVNEQEKERNAEIFGITIKAVKDFFGAAARAVLAFA